MTYARKNAIIAAIIWTLVLAGVLVTVLLPGAEHFTAPEYAAWRLLSAAVILPGFLANAWLGWRSKRGKERGEMDERDDAVARRASQGALLVTAMVVYLGAILLYEAYHDAGAVPTGWMWLLAYGTVAVVSLAHAVVSLIVDWAGTGDA